MITKEYQVTLRCVSGAYKPVSCIVQYQQEDDRDLSKEVFNKPKIIRKGIEKICLKRYWGNKDLEKYGYTRVKVRAYDKEKIEQEKKERYEAIKEQKYKSGEWQRPKHSTRETVE